MVELQKRRRRWPIWQAALLVVLFAAGGFYLAAPRVQSVTPAPGAQNVPRTTAIEIQFSRPMDPASVEARFSTDPAVSGETTWGGNTLRFFPTGGWPEAGEITVRLEAGARSAYRLPLLTSERWSFGVARPQLLYLAPPQGATELISHQLEQASGEALLQADAGIIDYDIAADGAVLAYLQSDGGGAASLHALELASGVSSEIYRCPTQARCTQVALATDGGWAALEVETTSESGTGVRQTTSRGVLALPLQDGAQAQELGPADAASHTPNWASPNKLGYYNEQARAVVVVERAADGDWRELTSVPHPLGERWAWSPDARFIVFPEVELFDEPTPEGVEFHSHLYRVEVETGLRTDLSGGPGALVEDAGPVYSPDGLWIAFGRKLLRPDQWTPGRQLWLMRSDGTQAAPLSDDPNYNHAGIVWNQGGTRLAYVRFLQVELDHPPEIWWLDLETEARSMLVEGGYEPRWMP